MPTDTLDWRQNCLWGGCYPKDLTVRTVRMFFFCRHDHTFIWSSASWWRKRLNHVWFCVVYFISHPIKVVSNVWKVICNRGVPNLEQERICQEGGEVTYSTGIFTFLAGLCDENGFGCLKYDINQIIEEEHCQGRPKNWRMGILHTSCIKIAIIKAMSIKEREAFCRVIGYIDAKDYFDLERKENASFSGILKAEMLCLSFLKLKELQELDDTDYKNLLERIR